MTNDELKMMGRLCFEAYDAHINERRLQVELDDNSKKIEELTQTNKRISALDTRITELEKNLEERTKDCEKLMKKLGALSITANLITGWQQSKKPRAFLKEFEEALKKCIRDNDIVLLPGWRAR